MLKSSKLHASAAARLPETEPFVFQRVMNAGPAGMSSVKKLCSRREKFFPPSLNRGIPADAACAGSTRTSPASNEQDTTKTGLVSKAAKKLAIPHFFPRRKKWGKKDTPVKSRFPRRATRQRETQNSLRSNRLRFFFRKRLPARGFSTGKTPPPHLSLHTFLPYGIREGPWVNFGVEE